MGKRSRRVLKKIKELQTRAVVGVKEKWCFVRGWEKTKGFCGGGILKPGRGKISTKVWLGKRNLDITRVEKKKRRGLVKVPKRCALGSGKGEGAWGWGRGRRKKPRRSEELRGTATKWLGKTLIDKKKGGYKSSLRVRPANGGGRCLCGVF